MCADRQNEHEVDRLLKQVLKDDLSSEAEFRMRSRTAAFLRGLESSDASPAASGAGRWRRLFLFERWRPLSEFFWREALVCVSVVMLAAGAVIHLGGHQSVLADSISLLNTSVSLARQIRLADSMDCVIKLTAAGAGSSGYRVRWVRDNRTRVDVKSASGVEETLWIIHGHVTAAGSSPRANPVPDLPEPVRALLSPTDLARRLDGGWQMQSKVERRAPDELVFTDAQDGAVIELLFDRKSLLPISLSRQPRESRDRGATATADLAWNLAIPPELMVPRPGPVR